MSSESIQFRNMSDRELLMLVIERQATHKESHEELKKQIVLLLNDVQSLKDSRTEMRGVNKFIIWVIGILGGVGTLLGIINIKP